MLDSDGYFKVDGARFTQPPMKASTNISMLATDSADILVWAGFLSAKRAGNVSKEPIRESRDEVSSALQRICTASR